MVEEASAEFVDCLVLILLGVGDGDGVRRGCDHSGAHRGYLGGCGCAGHTEQCASAEGEHRHGVAATAGKWMFAQICQNNRQKRRCWCQASHETSSKEAVPSLQNLVAIAKCRNKLLQHFQSEALERLAIDFVGQKDRDIFLKADRGEPVCNLLRSPFRGMGTCKVAYQRVERHEQHSLLEGTPFPAALAWAGAAVVAVTPTVPAEGDTTGGLTGTRAFVGKGLGCGIRKLAGEVLLRGIRNAVESLGWPNEARGVAGVETRFDGAAVVFSCGSA